MTAAQTRTGSIREVGVLIVPAAWWSQFGRSIDIRKAGAIVVMPDGPAWPDNADEVIAALRAGDVVRLDQPALLEPGEPRA